MTGFEEGGRLCAQSRALGASLGSLPLANSATILPGCGHTRRIPKPFARFERLEILVFSPLITLCLSWPFPLAAQSRREELEVLPGLGVLGPEPARAPSFVLSTL